MFGFLKKRLRNEHVKLVAQNRQMATELHQFYETHAKVMADSDSRERTAFLADLIAELDDAAAWLDRSEHLLTDKVQGLLDVNIALKSQLKQVESGREAARKLFR